MDPQMEKLTTILPVITIFSLFACGESDNQADPLTSDATPILDTQVLDCSDVGVGEVLTLENRNEGVDYLISCVLSVSGDLVIDPDVTIEFTTDAGISVNTDGSIEAIGTSDKPIVFTGEDKTPGTWRGIFVDSNDANNALSYVEIDYAGGMGFNSNDDRGAIIIYSDSRLTVTDSTIRNSETFGINANYGSSLLVLSDNTITACDAPISMLALYPGAISGGMYTGNTTDAIIANTAAIDVDTTWRDLGVPYQFPAGFRVIAGGTLTIEAGVTLEFGLNSVLDVNEGASGPKPSLIAVGTAQNPIIFTGIEKVKGAWQGVYFDTPSALNEIGFATIQYASDPTSPGAIYGWYGTVLRVHDVLFEHIQRDGIHVKAGASGHSVDNVNNVFVDIDGLEFATST